jgi:translation elongation factor EF-Tu-like GTPase
LKGRENKKLKMEEGKLIGKVIHYFGKIGVAIVQLEDILKIGDTIKIVGGKVDFTQTVDSMEVDHKKVNEAKAGELVGLKVIQKVKEGYKIYKL